VSDPAPTTPCAACPCPAAGVACPAIPGPYRRVEGSGPGPHPDYCRHAAADPARWGPRILRAARADAEGKTPGSPVGPGLARTARNFASALVGHVKAGRPKAPPEVVADRLATCEACPTGMFDPRARRCRHGGCGCFVNVKTTWADQKCPDGHCGPVGVVEGNSSSSSDLEAMREAKTEMGGLPVRMVKPSDRRPQIFRGGVLQILVTRACDLSCYGCSAGSNLVSRPSVMTPDQFDEACASLDGYFGTVGLFGGNPCTSRYFEDYCRIMRARFPFEQRGIWTNCLMGKGAHARITFCPKHSNVNVHMNSEAYEEFRRDWPEALIARKEHTDRGLAEDSRHGSPWVSMTDLGVPEDERWRLIGDCKINKHWSAIICLVRGELRGFLCEVQGHMAALHADNPDWAGTGAPMPDVGLPIVPGWWRSPLAAFESQVRTCCHHCAVPLQRPGQLAIGGEKEEFSPTHAYLARPKVRDRRVDVVSIGGSIRRGDRPATQYLPGVTPGYQD
jgi:hypothetical protein